MAATVQVSETYAAGTTQDNIANINFGSTSSYEIVPASYPITIPGSGTNYSYEKWIRLKCSGTYNVVDNLQFWKSAGTYSTGCSVYGNQSTSTPQPTSYTAAVNTLSTVATIAVPTSDPNDNNLSIDNSLTGSFTSNETAYSDYLVLQLRVDDTASPGNMNQLTFTFQYDEA